MRQEKQYLICTTPRSGSTWLCSLLGSTGVAGMRRGRAVGHEYLLELVGWIQNITGNLFTSEQGKWLFIYTSMIMFGLRFAAHWIETNLKVSPVGLLLICSVLAVVGLQLASTMETFIMALIALGIYAVGKTFFWPTMLAVASDRFGGRN